MAEGFLIHIDGDGSCFCRSDESVLAAMMRTGRGAVPVGCRGGGCGVCRVRVVAGRFRLGKISRSHLSAAEQADGVALACRLYPQSDLAITCAEVPPRSANKSEGAISWP